MQNEEAGGTASRKSEIILQFLSTAFKQTDNPDWAPKEVLTIYFLGLLERLQGDRPYILTDLADGFEEWCEESVPERKPSEIFETSLPAALDFLKVCGGKILAILRDHEDRRKVIQVILDEERQKLEGAVKRAIAETQEGARRERRVAIDREREDGILAKSIAVDEALQEGDRRIHAALTQAHEDAARDREAAVATAEIETRRKVEKEIFDRIETAALSHSRKPARRRASKKR